MKKKIILPVIMLLCIALLCACHGRSESKPMKNSSKSGEKEQEKGTECAEKTEGKPGIDGQWEKGYDLPVSEAEQEEAEADCKRIMELMADIYKSADKGDTANGILSEKLPDEMAERMKETGSPVRTGKIYANMENYEKFENFLKACMEGNCGNAVIYEIYQSGGIHREKYIYDGREMYVVAVHLRWGNSGRLAVSYLSFTRLKEWKYTKKGWFCYELCVPEYPEVTEMVDGSHLVRVKPITEENRKMSEQCVLGLAYQGNNLLCSDWDTNHMEKLDYNGLYEYFYAMKYQQRFQPEDYPDGIPEEEFESLMMEYLPITPEEIREYAVYDGENRTYEWAALGCLNYAPAFFGTSVPEVTGIRENEDGTVTLTVDAVCEMVLCDDAVITHELTVRFSENGSFQYLGNKILNNGSEKIPEYQYRINRDVF